MRCECCDEELNDSESTARFAESNNYVGMCKRCRGFLPRDLKIILRPDLERQKQDEVNPDVSEDTDWEIDNLRSTGLDFDDGTEWDDS